MQITDVRVRKVTKEGKMKAVDFARGLVNKGALEGRILS